MRARTGSVGVLGGGIAALAAAIAFRRGLPDATVTLFAGTVGAPEYAGAAAPFIDQFHRRVGIDPDNFRRRTGAVTAREAEVRRAGKPAFRLVPLIDIPHAEGAALHQLWLRHTGGDPARGPAWAEVARRALRPDDLAEGLGLRFDAEAYRALLTEVAGQIGVETTAETPTGAELAASFDLAIDASGQVTDEAGWERIDGIPAGLHWQVGATPGGTGQGADLLDFSHKQASWDTGTWRAEARIDAERPAAGRALEPMRANRLAVGRSAVQCETLDGQPLAVALAGITRALELLPRPGASGREAQEYNRRSGMVHGFLLDWAAERWGVRAAPAGLAALRGQFAERGRIPFRDEDPVPPGQWLGWLLGSGERPRHVDLTAMALPSERLAALFA